MVNMDILKIHMVITQCKKAVLNKIISYNCIMSIGSCQLSTWLQNIGGIACGWRMANQTS